MVKIWSGGASREGDNGIDDLMVGDDTDIDRSFVKYEAMTLLAYHIQVSRQKLIPSEDSRKILSSLVSAINEGITLSKELEDVHGNIEYYVLNKTGDSGKNLRLFLSRNEQIHTDILLFGKHELLGMAIMSAEISKALLDKRKTLDGVMPGYTHYRQGMVISLKSYFDYFASVFLESAVDLAATSERIRSVPFGYGSGFGSLSDADFGKVSELLGLEPETRNPQYLSLRRGMDEADLVYPLLKLLINVSRISHDLIMFSGDEMPIFKLPDGFVTGSSLMANKRNPDFLEVIQGYTSEAIGNFNSLMNMIANKSSGYHRDFQISKKIMVSIFRRVASILAPLPDFFSRIAVDPAQSRLLVKNSSYATANAKAIFSGGATWRDAYGNVGERILRGEKLDEIAPDDLITISEKDVESLISNISGKISEAEKVIDRLVSTADEISHHETRDS